MTREDMKLTVSQCVSAKRCEGYNEAIDKVFDEFESRTCVNCTGFTEDLDCGVDFQGQTPPADFGCNKFIRK